MEQQNISFQYGIHRNPTLSANDGELSECVNLIPANGTMINLPYPTNIDLHVNEGEDLQLVHKIGTKMFYVVFNKNENKLAFFTEEETNRATIHDFGEDIFNKVLIMGNTLIILTDKETIYYIYKDGEYTRFSQNDILYEAKLEYERRTGLSYTNPVLSFNRDEKFDTKESLMNLWSEIDAYKRNVVNNTDCTYDNVFCLITVQLYDGTEINVSDIISLQTQGGTTNIELERGTDYITWNSSIHAYKANLFIKALNNYDKNIVTGVNVYATAPTSFVKHDSAQIKNVPGYINIFTVYFTKKNKTEIIKEIGETIFYKIHSIEYDDFIAGKTINITLPSYGEDNFVSSTSNTNGIQANGGIVYNSRLFLFGTRRFTLSSTSIKTQKSKIPLYYSGSGSNISPVYGNINDANHDIAEGMATLHDFINIGDSYGTDGNVMTDRNVNVIYEYATKNIFGNTSFSYQISTKASYPLDPVITFHDSKASYVTLYIYDEYYDKYVKGTYRLYELSLFNTSIYVNLTEENYLSPIQYCSPFQMSENGSIIPNRQLASGWQYITKEEYENVLKIAQNPVYTERSNDITFSEAANPFSFPLENKIELGSANILSTSVATEAVSQGQFGQFPIYVFTTEGIYALNIATNGTITGYAPISRAVCNNPDAITQLDKAVLFTTETGLHLLAGSHITPLSEVMDGKNFNESILRDILPDFNHLIIPDTDSFRTMLATCHMLYDSVNSLVHIYPKGNGTKHYVWHTQTQQWSTFVNTNQELVQTDNSIKRIITGYPYSTLQLANGNLMQFLPSNNQGEETHLGFLLTRPIALSNPYGMKKVSDLRMLYSRNHRRSKCRIAIFVSNDRKKWHRLNSLRSHSYKWYRFAVFTDISDIDSLEGLTILYTNERTNKLR